MKDREKSSVQGVTVPASRPHRAKQVRVFSRGFTLLEILVALAVLSLVALAAVKASGNAVNNALYLKQQTLAHWVAMNKGAELELAEQWLAVGSRSGVAVMADTPWPWVVTGQQTPDRDIRRAEIAVWAGREEGEPLATLTVYVGRRGPE
jgi:general secretion pathway protein I